MYVIFAVLIGAAVGVLTCMPQPHTGLRGAMISVALGIAGSLLGWWVSDILGVDEISPLAQLFLSAVASVAVASVYHTVQSEPPPLR